MVNIIKSTDCFKFLFYSEINRRPGEAPKVRFTGNAKTMVARSGIREEDIKITISHSGSYAVAMAAVMRR